MDVQGDGSVAFEVRSGVSDPPRLRFISTVATCKESGNLREVGKELELLATESNCDDRAPGTQTRITPTWVNRCLVQWNHSGSAPYKVEQIAFKKRDCSTNP